MPLTIKNSETERLARDLAAATGQSLTGAITAALRSSLDQLATGDGRRAERLAALERISADAGRRWPAHLRDVDHDALLYDEAGVPR